MKRRLFKLVVFLLLGAVVNVAVAWGCAYWIDEKRKSHTRLFGPIPFEDAGWNIILYEKPGAIRVIAHGLCSLGFAHWREKLGSDVSREELDRAIEESSPYFCTVAEVEARLPSWSRANHPPQPRALTYYPIEDARGWPLISMRCSMDDYTVRLRVGDPNHTARRVHPEVISVVQEDRVVLRHKETGRILDERMLAEGDGVRNGILLPARVVRQTFYQIRALPLRAIWPGFAINTIFYAPIVWMLWSSPFVVRRFIRHRQGRCINCGYDLRGDFSAGCSECGWRRGESSACPSSDEPGIYLPIFRSTVALSGHGLAVIEARIGSPPPPRGAGGQGVDRRVSCCSNQHAGHCRAFTGGPGLAPHPQSVAVGAGRARLGR